MNSNSVYKGEVQNIFSLILIIVFVVFVIYLMYNYIKTSQKLSSDSPIIINTEMNAYESHPAIELPQLTSGLEHSISTWIYINDFTYNYGAPKHILWKGNPMKDEKGNVIAGNDGKICSPQLYIYPETNTLGVNTSTTFDGSTPEKCDVQNIPLMKWVHICYILKNRSVDIYINGKLERSTALKGIPVITNDKLWVTYGENKSPGFYGKIGKTQYFTYALNPNNVVEMYNQGPLGNTLYKISLFENNSLLSYSSCAIIDGKK
jgi:hypothetical protein